VVKTASALVRPRGRGASPQARARVDPRLRGHGTDALTRPRGPVIACGHASRGPVCADVVLGGAKIRVAAI
jgi:hypothetical protein